MSSAHFGKLAVSITFAALTAWNVNTVSLLPLAYNTGISKMIGVE